MDEIRVVENVLTHQGWRRVHFLSAKEKAFYDAREKWLASVPWESADHAHCLTFQEAGIWHCQVLWPLRGEVTQVLGIRDQGLGKNSPKDDVIILWTLTGKRERVSTAVEMAAWRYLAWFGEWPDTAWVGKQLSKYSGRWVKVEDLRVEIMAAAWMPDLSVGLGIRN